MKLHASDFVNLWHMKFCQQKSIPWDFSSSYSWFFAKTKKKNKEEEAEMSDIRVYVGEKEWKNSFTEKKKCVEVLQ